MLVSSSYYLVYVCETRRLGDCTPGDLGNDKLGALVYHMIYRIYPLLGSSSIRERYQYRSVPYELQERVGGETPILPKRARFRGIVSL